MTEAEEKEKYPNCVRLAAASEEHRTIMEFLDGIDPYELAHYQHDDGVDLMLPVRDKQRVVLEYLGVDPVELENERRAILENIRG